jgi:hypothetical protein
MKTSKTHGIFILDKSGSMDDEPRYPNRRQDVVKAFNEQVQQLRILSDSEPTFASLITFNGDVFEVKWREDVKTFPEATRDDYRPCGSTALFDAMGYTLSRVLKEDDGDTSYLIIIQSDGDNNASVQFKPSAVQELVKSCQSTGRYTIVYIGCEESVIRQVANDTGIPLSNMASMNTSNAFGYATASAGISTRVMDYSMSKSMDPEFSGTMNFCSAEAGKVANLSEESPAPGATLGTPTINWSGGAAGNVGTLNTPFVITGSNLAGTATVSSGGTYITSGLLSGGTSVTWPSEPPKK